MQKFDIAKFFWNKQVNPVLEPRKKYGYRRKSWYKHCFTYRARIVEC